MTQSVSDVVNDADGTFEQLWTDFGVPRARQVQRSNSWVTPAYNKGAFHERLKSSPDEVAEKTGQDASEVRDYRGMAKHAIAQAAKVANAGDKPGGGVDKDTLVQSRKQNIIDRNVAENSTPLVFDPNVRPILSDAAPIVMDRITRRGQEGYTLVFNRVDDREAPLGRVPESVAVRLQDYARDFDLSREDVDMKIYADTAEISDFSATASSHYMDLDELAIGARMGEWARFHEQEFFYGDPTVGLEGGSPVGDYATPGISKWYSDAGRQIDKSAVTENFWTDLKWEITSKLFQTDFAVSIDDLEVYTSHTFVNTLEDEVGSPEGGVLRMNIDAEAINVGGQTLQVKGEIPIFGTRNIGEHTYVAQDEEGTENDEWAPYDEGDTGYAEETVGSEGDVFVVDTSVTEVRELAPLSTFPLAVRGAADEVAMVQYGANVELSGGNFGLHLQNYAGGDLSPA